MKYNKHYVMSTAWTIRRRDNVSMSTALKAAWAIVKAENAAEAEGSECGWNYTVKTSPWTKYGKSRTYIETRIYTNAWNYKRSIYKVYIDNLTGETVAA